MDKMLIEVGASYIFEGNWIEDKRSTYWNDSDEDSNDIKNEKMEYT